MRRTGPATALESLGLGGDGDEWNAIRRVEADFGVQLDGRDAPRWVTVGDVFSSLLDALGPDRRDRDAAWWRFAAALAVESGVDPLRVAPATRLLAVPVWDLVGRWLRRVTGRRG